MSVDISKYFPSIYSDIEEIKQICDTENTDFDEAEVELTNLLNNQFIMTSDERGIEYREKLLGILANPQVETLDFRRLRLINRISIQPPFTMLFLRERLDDIIGVGEYNAYIDYDKYTLYIESTAKNQIYSHEIAVTLNMIKPANIVYINIPTIVSPILIGETISRTNLIWNYRLGTQWVLGQKPFLSYANEEVFKMANIPSITKDGINALCTTVQTDIVKAIINDTLEITDFVSKDVTDSGETIISYSIPVDSGIEVINNVKLVDSAGTIYFNSNIYVPVEQEVIMKHTIRIKEG